MAEAETNRPDARALHEPESSARRGAANERGFTLVELLTAGTVLAALAALALPQFAAYRLQAQIAKAIADIRTLDTSVQLFRITNGVLPTSITEIASGGALDPWGEPYQYLKIDGNTKAKGHSRKDKFLVPINSDFDLYSMGPDRKSSAPLTSNLSQDDIVRANDGRYVGRAADY
jgi:general secretion pathway protein G